MNKGNVTFKLQEARIAAQKAEELRREEERKRQEEERKKREEEKRRKQEERRKEQEERQRREEEERRKEAELREKRKAVEEKRKADEEKRRLELEKRREEEELARKKAEEAQRKAEEERKAREKALEETRRKKLEQVTTCSVCSFSFLMEFDITVLFLATDSCGHAQTDFNVLLILKSTVQTDPPGGTPLYGLYRYVRRRGVWFFSRFGHKLGIDFGHFGHK